MAESVEGRRSGPTPGLPTVLDEPGPKTVANPGVGVDRASRSGSDAPSALGFTQGGLGVVEEPVSGRTPELGSVLAGSVPKTVPNSGVGADPAPGPGSVAPPALDLGRRGSGVVVGPAAAACGLTSAPTPTPTSTATARTVRLRLDLAYDGTNFAGWGRQPGQRTVQGELERLVGLILRLAEPVTATVAGRTDAGVHARGQVCHVDVPATMTSNRGQTLHAAAALRRWLPGALPADLALHSVTIAPPGFDARFSAAWRRYVYRLCDDPLALDPLTRGFVALVGPALDVAAMTAAAPALLGLHDFAAFCKARPGATSIRRLLRCDVVRVGPGRIDITVAADAFCHSMVRSLVGALGEVGHGRRGPAWLAGLVDRTERAGEVPVAPAAGLTLEEVGYPPVADLATRALAARQVRRPVEDTAAPHGRSPGVGGGRRRGAGEVPGESGAVAWAGEEHGARPDFGAGGRPVVGEDHEGCAVPLAGEGGDLRGPLEHFGGAVPPAGEEDCAPGGGSGGSGGAGAGEEDRALGEDYAGHPTVVGAGEGEG